MNLSVRVGFDRLPQLSAQLAAKVQQVNRKTALDVQRDWAAGVRVATGQLKNSILGAAGHVREETDTSVTVGTSIEHAPFEEYGTRRMPGSHARTKAVEKHRGPHRQAVAQVLRP